MTTDGSRLSVAELLGPAIHEQDRQGAAFEIGAVDVARSDVLTAIEMLEGAGRKLRKVDGLDTEDAVWLAARLTDLAVSGSTLAAYIEAKIEMSGGRGPRARYAEHEPKETERTI